MKHIIVLILIFLFFGYSIAQSNAFDGSTDLSKQLSLVGQQQKAIEQATPNRLGGHTDGYCIPGADCTFGDGLTYFMFAGIENLNSGCSPEGYGNFTTMLGTAKIGSSYTAVFQSAYADQKVSMWIDFNNDIFFSDQERMIADFNLADANTFYGMAINIPGWATPGVYRLRVGSSWTETSSGDACANFSYGEWEDYLIHITGESIRKNASVTAILLNPVMPAIEFRPTAFVSNMGLDTISFPATITDFVSGYESTKFIDSLPPGESVKVYFSSWDTETGDYDVKVCTQLEGDENPGDDCSWARGTFSSQPRQKVLAELFTGTWCEFCPFAELGLKELYDEYPGQLAIIAWHNNDEFEIPQQAQRSQWYNIKGHPAAWFDGSRQIVGGYNPSSYPLYQYAMESRVAYSSNFEIRLAITGARENVLNVETTVRSKNGNFDENIAAFIVLTETDLSAPGNEPQQNVARAIYPDTAGYALDFSNYTAFSWTTQLEVLDEYVLDNCEIVVFIQNMDTKEIYQATSKMADDVSGLADVSNTSAISVFPNPAKASVHIEAVDNIQQVKVYNQMGQLVYQSPGSSRILKVNTGNFKSGLYLFKVQSAKGFFVESVIIE